jgi:hypothetical protein
MPIPSFRDDGCLPEGLHLAILDEVRERFGMSSDRRRELMPRIEQWVEMAKSIQALRFALAGSFVTEKASPNDVDAIMLLPDDFQQRISRSDPSAWEIEHSVRYKEPPELFVAYSEPRWSALVEFFGRVRGTGERRKGLIEVVL